MVFEFFVINCYDEVTVGYVLWDEKKQFEEIFLFYFTCNFIKNCYKVIISKILLIFYHILNKNEKKEDFLSFKSDYFCFECLVKNKSYHVPCGWINFPGLCYFIKNLPPSKKIL